MLAKTSDDYAPCVVLSPDGSIRKANVLHVRLQSKDRAMAELAAGHTVWVTPDVADEIRESWLTKSDLRQS
jgi:hypothetical protein